MINMKKLLIKILQTLNDSVSKSGDTLTGDLHITKDGATGRVRATCLDNGATVADGQLAVTDQGSCGVYDNLHSKWVIRTDSNGYHHAPISAVSIYTTKKACSRVGTTYEYTSISALENWNVIAVRFTVHEVSQVLFFVRGESHERSLVDTPSTGRFRGGIYVDWANNRIGMRCINGGSGTYYNLIIFDRVYGVL